MRAWYSCLQFPNAPPSQISPFGHPKCERGAHICIAKRSPYRRFRWSHEGLRSGETNVHIYIYTYIHIYTFTCHEVDQGHDANYSSIVGFGVGGMPRSAIPVEVAKRPSMSTAMPDHINTYKKICMIMISQTFIFHFNSRENIWLISNYTTIYMMRLIRHSHFMIKLLTSA